jgi:hypothetical protein
VRDFLTCWIAVSSASFAYAVSYPKKRMKTGNDNTWSVSNSRSNPSSSSGPGGELRKGEECLAGWKPFDAALEAEAWSGVRLLWRAAIGRLRCAGSFSLGVGVVISSPSLSRFDDRYERFLRAAGDRSASALWDSCRTLLSPTKASNFLLEEGSLPKRLLGC